MVVTMMLSRMFPHQRDEVAEFVNEEMRRRYGCDAYPLPAVVFVVRCAGVILGTIGLMEPVDGLLPIEKMYDVNEKLPQGVIQFGRWIGQSPRVSIALMTAAARYSCERGYRWGISEVKPQVLRRLRQLGVHPVILSGSLRWDRVPDAVRPYYAPPSPSLVIVSLEELCVELEKWPGD